MKNLWNLIVDWAAGLHLSDKIVSLIRTFVPIAVGSVITWLLSKGIGGLDPSKWAEVVTPFVIGVYYWVVRQLEERWPIFGVLLGVKKRPTYS